MAGAAINMPESKFYMDNYTVIFAWQYNSQPSKAYKSFFKSYFNM